MKIFEGHLGINCMVGKKKLMTSLVTWFSSHLLFFYVGACISGDLEEYPSSLSGSSYGEIGPKKQYTVYHGISKSFGHIRLKLG